MSVRQKSTPFGGTRGRVLERSGGEVVLETGTERREWKREKEEACGPKGKKGWILESDAKIETPLSSWPVTTRRGAGSGAIVMFVKLFKDIQKFLALFYLRFQKCSSNCRSSIAQLPRRKMKLKLEIGRFAVVQMQRACLLVYIPQPQTRELHNPRNFHFEFPNSVDSTPKARLRIARPPGARPE